ncbi:hemolymph lipopolysaccharide-binding protein-like isoform X1 [Schistocerca nitens]|uniref:hemolymph lipopolysaccharide-binding protein-like isoform X1 n=1 Tax=Schistocerca nitens TaxID=7011 RepID=UPI002117D33B|nr:hemolymph lipopolysaccharide-binding protein-like isoform X1 [Schistocerca nitens]
MAAEGLPLGVKLLAFVLTLCGLSSAERSVHFRSAVSRNATGHWTVSTAVLHDGQRRPEDNEQTIVWGTYDLSFTSLLRNNQQSLVTTILVTVPPEVHPDYKLYDGIGYYKIHKRGSFWNEANETCRNEGAHLVVINSKREEDVVKGIVKDSGTEWAYIGLHRDDKEEFRTVLGDSLSSLRYQNWNSDHPRYVSGENCASVSYEGVIDDDSCRIERYFVCEVPL